MLRQFDPVTHAVIDLRDFSEVSGAIAADEDVGEVHQIKSGGFEGQQRGHVAADRDTHRPAPPAEAPQLAIAQAKPGGGTKPPISAASRRANSIVVRSSPSAPIIWQPTGR